MLCLYFTHFYIHSVARQTGGKALDPGYTDMIAEAGTRGQIKEPVTPLILRHTCAFMLRQAGVNIEIRAKMLGHSIETASKYGAPGENEIEKTASLLDHTEAA